jgi:hypothetical protein
MTPKEKAEELFNKFANVIYDRALTVMQYEICKGCALIAVEYMDEACGSALSAMGLPDKHIEQINIQYLEDLKQEIEKL